MKCSNLSGKSLSLRLPMSNKEGDSGTCGLTQGGRRSFDRTASAVDASDNTT